MTDNELYLNDIKRESSYFGIDVGSPKLVCEISAKFVNGTEFLHVFTNHFESVNYS